MGAVITAPLTIIVGLLPGGDFDIFFACKWLLSFLCLELYRRLKPKRLSLYDSNCKHDPEKLNLTIPQKEYDLESPFSESHLLKAKDEVFFYGVNSKGERLVVSIRRHCHQKAEAFLLLKLESGLTYRLVRTAGVQQASADKHAFSCGGLQLHYTYPMRRWRLFYNGYLRETSGNDSATERIAYVKFAMIFRASSDIFDFSDDINTYSLARGLASYEWNGLLPPLGRFKKALNAYSQSGIFHGTVTIDDKLADYEMYLFGQRFRDLGSNLSFKNMEFHHLLGYTQKNGMFIHLGELSCLNNPKSLCFGYVIYPDTTMKEITKVNGRLTHWTLSTNIRMKTEIFAERAYECQIFVEECIKEDKPTTENWIDVFHQISLDLNGKNGKGIYIRRKSSGISEMKTSYTPEIKCPSVAPRTVSFKDELCQIPEVTGGKGSSLGKLTYLSQQLNTFIVPEGIVVTTSAYEEILTPTIFSKIRILEQVLCGNNQQDVKEACERVQEAIAETKFPFIVQSAIEQSMKKNFGTQLSTLKFAVRSSATGEDTEQMSAAGQMETFLGVCGLDEVLQAVKKCWASQFSFIAVQYKRRYGQCLNSPMAVVIQKMIPCDTAGVLFTCDPTTGNPTKITITANYGLGESVVSGSEEPDTILLDRGINDELHVRTIDVGAKSNKIILKEDTGTSMENIPESQKGICCLSAEKALRLGQLAIKIENYYRSTRDLEWGFYNNNLYIFQSRPVTTGSNETTFEIDHEFDGPMRVENDFFSTSNVGEVMPGAASVLGYEFLIKIFLMGLERLGTDTTFRLSVIPRYYNLGWLKFCGHGVFNVIDVFNNLQGDTYDSMTQALLISLFGRIIDDEEILQVTRERYGETRKGMSLKSLFSVAKNLLFSASKLRKAMEDCRGYHIPVDTFSTSKELFNELLRRVSSTLDPFISHMNCTEASSTWNMIIFSTLGKEHGAYDDIVYRDFANLLRTSSDVESADVPAAIQNLAFHVSEALKPEEFKKMTPDEALQWLQTSSSTAGKKFRAFIEKHGHRCLKEFDMLSVTWGSDPRPLVKILQNLAGKVSINVATKESKSPNEIISELKVKLGFLSKLKLKFLLPISRRSVQNRETSKSLFIKIVDAYRKGFNHLASMMVAEGRIPDKDLLFFMTLEDIKQLLETRSPKIISRAIQRQRRHPILDKYQFPEIMKGLPRPINEFEDPIIPTSSDFSMKGIPVSQGLAKGFIRIALTLEEAEFLKHGEILLTLSTDIGWTPYFPILSGVVTELGGLISHGAVVSREYGIPCIAGMHGATKRFQTGDYVLLDGNKGVLQKLIPPVS